MSTRVRPREYPGDYDRSFPGCGRVDARYVNLLTLITPYLHYIYIYLYSHVNGKYSDIWCSFCWHGVLYTEENEMRLCGCKDYRGSNLTKTKKALSKALPLKDRCKYCVSRWEGSKPEVKEKKKITYNKQKSEKIAKKKDLIITEYVFNGPTPTIQQHPPQVSYISLLCLVLLSFCLALFSFV